ncbi:uncharacterized protein LOC144434649 isoform X2 [Glandiceps talaboti]
MFCCLVVVFLLLCFFRSGLVTTATLTLDTFDCNHTPLTTTEETNFKAFSNVQCALQCLAVSDCGGYSFDRRTSICEIFDVLPVSAPTHASKRYYPKPQQELFVSNTEDVCTTNSPCQNGGLCRRDCRRNEGYICTCNEVIWTGKQCEDNAQYVIYTGAAPQTDTDDAQSTVSCPASSMTIMTCRCNMEFCDGAKLMNDTCVAYNDNIADGNKVKAEIGCSTNVHPDDVITLSSGVVLNPIVFPSSVS